MTDTLKQQNSARDTASVPESGSIQFFEGQGVEHWRYGEGTIHEIYTEGMCCFVEGFGGRSIDCKLDELTPLPDD